MNVTWLCLLLAVTLLGIQWVEGTRELTPSKSLKAFRSFSRSLGKSWENRLKTTLRKKRAMALKPKYRHGRWPGGVVNYVIDQRDFSPSDSQRIVNAMKEYEKYTCVRFVNRPAKNMLKFIDGNSCATTEGMYGGVQEVELGNCRKFLKGGAMHEIGHALGLIHEHQRPDRDQYLQIFLENVVDNQKDEFTKYRWDEVENENIPFDYQSIMEYYNIAMSKNGKKTMLPKNRDDQVLGQTLLDDWVAFTFNDAKAVNLMYKCSAHCGMTDDQCPGEGYVGPDCKCWCKHKWVGMVYKECKM